MNTDRRAFLKGTAWMGAVAMAAGCTGAKGLGLGSGGSMQGFAAKPLKKVRVGVCGLGMRGPGAVHRIAAIPGAEIAALCELHQVRVDAQQKFLAENGKPKAKEYVGPEAYKAMCESDDIDLVYNATPWQMHVPIALYAMEHGKHVAIEVPSALTLEDCWALVETAERTRRHCYQLENCCYGEIEMLTMMLARADLLGELKHAECAYIHDLRDLNYRDWAPDPTKDGKWGYNDYWRLRWNTPHKGNQYTTHGLGPVCQYMNINRGDRMDYLVSLESQQAGFELFARQKYPDTWKAELQVAMGDMNTTLVKTVNGRSIMIQHDVSSPRPYSRINLVSGTKGILKDYPYQLALEESAGAGAHAWFDEKKAGEIREKYKHPLWKKAGEFAQKIGGHGGMDFLMDLRLIYCLQNGLPLDTDVYDLATWCSIAELSEKSVRNRSCSMDVPDFTRGGWKTAPAFGIVDVDLAKMGLDVEKAKSDKSALNV